MNHVNMHDMYIYDTHINIHDTHKCIYTHKYTYNVNNVLILIILTQ